jgi:hypothetical protein
MEFLLSSLGIWAVAASTGAVAGWTLNYIRERWNRPKLELTVDHECGSVVETETNAGDRQKYARLVVHNRGRTLARNCCAFIDYIKRTDPTGSHYVFRSDLLNLNWSLLREAARILHVPSRGYRLLDVGHTHISESDFSAAKFDKSIFWIDGEIIPNRLLPELRMNTTYEMHIRAYADNAAPAELSCRVILGNTFRDLTFEPYSDPRPRDQR